MARVFMLSPFGEPFDSYFSAILKPGLSRHGHTLTRADESHSPGVIIQSIFQSILDADIVIADMTRSNANVFYELGIAHSYGRQVILVAQSTSDLPFDVRHMRCIPYQPGTEGWETRYVSELVQAITDATLTDCQGVALLSSRLFSGKYLRKFKEVINVAERMLAEAESYFFVTRTSPNEAILPHESRYFQITEQRIKGLDSHAPVPNYRRLVHLNSRDSLALASSLLAKYWECPNFQMAVFSNRYLPVNFEVFISDDKAVLLAFGAQQASGPVDSGMFIQNETVALKWKTFYLNLWEHPETVIVKPSGSLSSSEYEAAVRTMNELFLGNGRDGGGVPKR